MVPRDNLTPIGHGRGVPPSPGGGTGVKPRGGGVPEKMGAPAGEGGGLHHDNNDDDNDVTYARITHTPTIYAAFLVKNVCSW